MTDAALDAATTPLAREKLDWALALRALRKLLRDKNDTLQVFTIMRALNGGSTARGYQKLLGTLEGGRIAYDREELAQRLMDRAYLDSFPQGSVGAAYRSFLNATGYTADGLKAISEERTPEIESPHPYAWFGRRTRDVHDLWHVLTGYKADEGLGEACLVAFSYAQTKSLGWAFIALGAAVRSGLTGVQTKAIREGYRHGKRAKWLLGQDYDALLNEPLEAARRRLRIARPAIYDAIPAELRDVGLPG